MKALLLLLCAWWIAAGVGRLALDRLRILQSHPLEQAVYSSALGLGIAAYGILALGLCGWLSFWPVSIWWIVLSGVGILGMLANARDLHRWLKSCWPMKAPSSLPAAIMFT